MRMYLPLRPLRHKKGKERKGANPLPLLWPGEKQMKTPRFRCTAQTGKEALLGGSLIPRKYRFAVVVLAVLGIISRGL